MPLQVFHWFTVGVAYSDIDLDETGFRPLARLPAGLVLVRRSWGRSVACDLRAAGVRHSER